MHVKSNPTPAVKPMHTSNLDRTRSRVVKKGCLVEFPGGATARVYAVRLGRFSTTTAPVRMSFSSCADVRVIAEK